MVGLNEPLLTVSLFLYEKRIKIAGVVYVYFFMEKNFDYDFLKRFITFSGYEWKAIQKCNLHINSFVST